jgi:putative DNA primase/helicase
MEIVAGALGVPATGAHRTAAPVADASKTITYEYVDTAGRPVLRVVRTDCPDGSKRFAQSGPTADGHGWQSSTEHAPKPKPLYRLHEILRSSHGEPIVIHEGEKACHAALDAGLPGIHSTTVGGSSNPKQTDFAPLKNRCIVIVPDRDEPGEKYASEVSRLAITAGAQSVKICRLPGLPPKGDVVEWLESGGTPARFAELLAQAETLEAPDVQSVNEKSSLNSGLVLARGGEKIKLLAEDILRGSHFAKDCGGNLYAYREGCFTPGGGEHIRQQVKAKLIDGGSARLWSTRLSDEIVAYIGLDTPMFWTKPPRLLNVKNGLLDLGTRELHPHTADHLWPIQLPVTFDPVAPSPAWTAFVEQTFPEDCQGMVWELAAWLIDLSLTLQKAVLFEGPGGNGKGRALAGLMAFVGERNVSTLSLQRLESDRFSPARLLGKVANVCPDLPSTTLENSSVFKSLTGGDTLLGENKFSTSFEFKPFVRLLFSANHFPRSRDSSAAFFRRWRVIPFARQFSGTGEEINEGELDARLATPSELSGLLNKALDALPQLRARGDFFQSESTRIAELEFREMTDPVSAFLSEAYVDDGVGSVTKKDLLIHYTAWAESHGHPPISPKAFTLSVTRLKPRLVEVQRVVNGDLSRCWQGLRPKDSAPLRDTSWTDSSQDSQHSQDFTTSLRAEAEEIVIDEREKKLENPVNPVNAVSGDLFDGQEEIIDVD